MGLILKSEADMLRELDTYCHADGLSHVNFLKVGQWVALVGASFDMSVLHSSTLAAIKILYRKHKRRAV